MSIYSYSWKYLTEIIQNNRNTEQLQRHPDMADLYQQNVENIISKYGSLSDHIKIKYMNWKSVKCCEDLDDRLCAVRKTGNHSLYDIIIKNDFPYNLRKGLEHYVLFSVTPLTDEQVQLRIRYHFENIKAGNFLWFVNQESNQSIPDLWHCHIIIKN